MGCNVEGDRQETIQTARKATNMICKLDALIPVQNTSPHPLSPEQHTGQHLVNIHEYTNLAQ